MKENYKDSKILKEEKKTEEKTYRQKKNYIPCNITQNP